MSRRTRKMKKSVMQMTQTRGDTNKPHHQGRIQKNPAEFKDKARSHYKPKSLAQLQRNTRVARQNNEGGRKYKSFKRM